MEINLPHLRGPDSFPLADSHFIGEACKNMNRRGRRLSGRE